MNIGKLKLQNRFLLAPMHEVNCLAFRILCKEYGASMVTTPMIHVNRIISKNKLPIEISKSEKPLSIQLVGDDKTKFKKAVKIIEPFADIIDLNFGCPSNDIVNNKSGGYLLKYPKRLGEIINTVVTVANVPVTAKIRSGFDKCNVNVLGKVVEENGADAIALHARTVVQGYSGKSNWHQIKLLKKELTIPVIGNGDVFSGVDGRNMLNKTDCDFVMIGRGAMGYPLIFEECLDANFQPTLKEREKCFRRFIKLYENQNDKSLSEFRNHLMWMFKGLRGASKVRDMLSQIKDRNELKEASLNYFKKYHL